MFDRRFAFSCLLLVFFLNLLLPAYGGNSNTEAYPKTTGKAVILIDASSGRVLYGKNIHKRLPPASVTKIMTALLVIENGNLDQSVTISSRAAATPESSVWLEAGEKLTRQQLFYALMLNSANDAATALSESVAGSEKNFVSLMNRRAKQLGMQDSHFINPHGLHANGHYTSAYDLALLSREAMKNSTFRKVVRTKVYHIPWGARDYDRLLINHNRLLWRYKSSIGIKTGYTRQAGNCLVGAAQKGSLTLIAVSLNSKSAFQDVQQVFDYGFARYHNQILKASKEISVEVPVQNGVNAKVHARPAADLTVAVTDKEVTQLSYKLYPQDLVDAPVKKGQTLGYCQVLVAGKEATRIKLLASNSVAKRNPFLRHFGAVCLAVFTFLLKVILVVFLGMYLIRLFNLWRQRKKRRASRRRW